MATGCEHGSLLGHSFTLVQPWPGGEGTKAGRVTEGKECTVGRPTFHLCTQTSRSTDIFPACRPALKGVRGQLPEGSLRASCPDQRSYVRFHEALRLRVTVWGSGRGARLHRLAHGPCVSANLLSPGVFIICGGMRAVLTSVASEVRTGRMG